MQLSVNLQLGTPIVDNKFPNQLTIYSKFVDSLILIHENISELPPDFFAWFPHLHSLNLSHNHISRIPDSIGSCSRLFAVT